MAGGLLKSERQLLCMGKLGSICDNVVFPVLCLLAYGDSDLKSKFLLAFGVNKVFYTPPPQATPLTGTRKRIRKHFSGALRASGQKFESKLLPVCSDLCRGK